MLQGCIVQSVVILSYLYSVWPVKHCCPLHSWCCFSLFKWSLNNSLICWPSSSAKDFLHCCGSLSLLFQAASDKSLHWDLMSLSSQPMVVPLSDEGSQVPADPWQVDVMKIPEMHFTVYVPYTFTLQEVDGIIINIRQSLPHVIPEPLNTLVMSAPASDSTASLWAPEHFHHHTDISFLLHDLFWP